MKLGMDVRTAQTHVYNARRRLRATGARTTTAVDLARTAVAIGLITIEEFVDGVAG